MLHAVQEGTSVLTSGKLILVYLDNYWLKVVVLVLHLNFIVSWSWDLALEVAHVINQSLVLATVQLDHGLREVEELSSLFYR